MRYILLADLVVTLHFVFILFVIFGGFLSFRWPRFLWIHLPAAAWAVYIELSGGICPLTPLENYLGRLGGKNTYSGDFIAQYILPIIYPAYLTRQTQYIFGAGLILLNLLIYGRLWIKSQNL